MSELPIDPTLYLLINLHCFLGGLGAVIARLKGRRNFIFWLILGLIGGEAIFLAALLMKGVGNGKKGETQTR